MQYSQVYLFIKNNGKALNYKGLKKLANGAPIYISKQSRRNVAMERRCDIMRDAASILTKDDVFNDISVVAISCTSVNDLLYMAISSNLVATCWIDSEPDLNKILDLLNGYWSANGILSAACDLLDAYNDTLAPVAKYLSSKPFSDDDLLKHVDVLASRDTELQDAIRLALKAAVRNGILNRIDLQ